MFLKFTKRKGKLLLGSFTFTMLNTLVVLTLVLLPSGNLPLLEEQWQAWMGRLVHSLVPAASTNEERNRTETLPHYSLTAQLDTEQHRLVGHAVITLPYGNWKDISFYLFNPISISKVEWQRQSLPYQAESNFLTVHLPAPVQGVVSLNLSFITPVPHAVTRLGEWEGVWSLDYWYPILAVRQGEAWLHPPQGKGFGDPFLMDLANYDVRLQYPRGFTWYASSPQTLSENHGQEVQGTWSGERLRNFALIGARSWQSRDWRTEDGVQVHVVAQAKEHLDELSAVAQYAIRTYTQRFGSLAYPSLSLIEMPSGTVFAHEYPNLALFSRDIWGWNSGERWIAHEIAHAWWYSSVGDYKALDPWLDEGMADYAARLYLENRYGAERYRQQIREDWNLFVQQRGYSPRDTGDPIGPVTQATDHPYAFFQNDGIYYYLEYLRPVLMYHDLRLHMGEEKFDAFLQQFYLKNRLQTATRQDLEDALRQVAPEQLPLLKLWLDAPNPQLIERVKGDFSS